MREVVDYIVGHYIDEKGDIHYLQYGSNTVPVQKLKEIFIPNGAQDVRMTWIRCESVYLPEDSHYPNFSCCEFDNITLPTNGKLPFLNPRTKVNNIEDFIGSDRNLTLYSDNHDPLNGIRRPLNFTVEGTIYVESVTDYELEHYKEDYLYYAQQQL